MKTKLSLIIAIFLCNFVVAQPLVLPKHNHQHKHDHNHSHDHAPIENDPAIRTKISPNIAFVKNLNQWNEKIEYKATLGGINSLYLEQRAFTYVFAKPEDLENLHDLTKAEPGHSPIHYHAYKVNFKNAQDVIFKEEEKRSEYYNFFIGNDPNKWASEVPLHNKITYPNLYPGIDLKTYDREGHFKYDFIVSPFTDPNQIQMEYEAADAVEIDNSNLIIYTSVETVIEQEPYAYQIIDRKEVKVACEYELNGNTVSFIFPDGYDQSIPLVIDPIVVAATLSGTVGFEQNFGHTATFDNEGNMYAGGRSFGVGYPTTLGAFQINFAGGEVDIAVTKYNSTGTAQIYATYIGGSLSDLPHSMVTDFNGQLFIFGSSYSLDYPVTSNAFQTEKGLSNDIVITKLNSNGSALVGSTFMGGSSSDGVNNSTLNSNYDDHYRGEIVLDNQGNAYVTSCSSSDNFPVTPGAFDTELNASSDELVQDAVVFKMNSDLSTLFWSTFLGSDDPDAGFGLRVDDFGTVYVTGIAGDSNFPTTGGTVQPNWGGGTEDAFITILNSTGSDIIASTFWGSSGDEHGFFLDIDEDNQVHIYGQTTGTMPITSNTYFANENSRQFISAFSNRLDELIYSTVIGNGPTFGYDFVPVAFMVDKCNNIYFSGYYAAFGLPTTSDAISNVGGSFYIGVLDPLASALQFGTYYGEADHVDGGTSRFDKSGTVYQGVCSCTMSGVLNTLPGAHAESQFTACDIGVFKIDFEVPTVTSAAIATPGTSGCAPFEVDFFYTGQDATVFEWYFDDNGDGASTPVTSHTFTEPGTYEVMLVASNEITCNTVDTSFLIIDVLSSSTTLSETIICNPDEVVFLDATTTNATYSWMNGSTGATISADGPGVYWVDISLLDGACTRRDSFVVALNNSLNIDLGNDLSVCDENSFLIDGTTPGAVSYAWNNGSNDPMITVTNPGFYTVSITDSEGCISSDNIEVIFSTSPIIDLGPDTLLCDLYTVTLDPDFPNAVYAWSDGSTNENLVVTDPGIYWVEVNNDGCFGSDTIEISYYAEVFLEIETEELDCFQDCDGAVDITISGGNGPFNFQWSTGETTPDIDELCVGNYVLTITDDICSYVLTDIDIIEPLPIYYELAIEDVVCFGDGNGSISITNISGGTPPLLFSFNGEPFTDNPNLVNLGGGEYDIAIIDANGCLTSETVSVYEPPFILVDAGPDQMIELGESVELEGIVTPLANQNILWSPADSLSCTDCVQPIADPTSTMIYTLTVVDSITGCTQVDEVLVRVAKNRNVFVPNVFSPNGDGINDLFTIFTGNGVRSINKFRVYNRWGALVYEGTNIVADNHTFGWDGVFKGKPSNNAVFAWYAEVEFIDDEVILYKGDVTLVK